MLSSSKRGHTYADTVRACALIKSYGFTLVGQMMIGLPSATSENEIMTAKAICDLGASEARIYPIVILKGTHLAYMAEIGEYAPLTENELIERSADVLSVFRKNGVKVLRIGLHAGDELTSRDEIASGFYHPAMGELVEGELYYREIKDKLKYIPENGTVTVTVPRGCLSKAIGQKGKNRERLKKEFGLKKIVFKESVALKNIIVE